MDNFKTYSNKIMAQNFKTHLLKHLSTPQPKYPTTAPLNISM
jgi:hypothetical protein